MFDHSPWDSYLQIDSEAMTGPVVTPDDADQFLLRAFLQKHQPGTIARIARTASGKLRRLLGKLLRVR